jgi:hypothetical protein
VIAIAAGRSPSAVENAYAAAVASKKNLTGKRKGRLIILQKGGDEKAYSARKTKTFVQTPGWSFKALVPNASNAVSMTRIVVQPW